MLHGLSETASVLTKVHSNVLVIVSWQYTSCLLCWGSYTTISWGAIAIQWRLGKLGLTSRVKLTTVGIEIISSQEVRGQWNFVHQNLYVTHATHQFLQMHPRMTGCCYYSSDMSLTDPLEFFLSLKQYAKPWLSRTGSNLPMWCRFTTDHNGCVWSCISFMRDRIIFI